MINIRDYPRPQLVRKSYIKLNGFWDFMEDDAYIGKKSGWQNHFPQDTKKINVPYTYDTEKSALNETEEHSCVWYHRSLQKPGVEENDRLIVHFEGCNYKTSVWMNGRFLGVHNGGGERFSFDVTAYMTRETNEMTVCISSENSGARTQPAGIWKTVWMEIVPELSIKTLKLTPDLLQKTVEMEFTIAGLKSLEADTVNLCERNIELKVNLYFNETLIRRMSCSVTGERVHLSMSVLDEKKEVHLWEPDSPNLYELRILLCQPKKNFDSVYSYFGMREISIVDAQVFLNGKSLYQKLVLYHGYWKQSGLTAPDEAAVIEDMDKIKEMGFNGIRMHKKLESENFLYWCDRKGLLVWAEMGVLGEFDDDIATDFTKEIMEIVQQNYNHPSLITWMIFHEPWDTPQMIQKKRDFAQALYYLTKSYDATRPVITSDGSIDIVSDIFTRHDYDENLSHCNDTELSFIGKPVILSEFGGIAFECSDEKCWGYGKRVVSEEEFLTRLHTILQEIQRYSYLSGYCYTQFSDVQKEIDGLLTADRVCKVDTLKVREIL